MKDTERKNPNRIQKVNSLIEHQLAPILLTALEGQKGLVTITKVETSRDMKWAKVWISILPTSNPHPSRPLEADETPSPIRRRQGYGGQEGRGGKSLSQTGGKSQTAPSFDDKILKFLHTNIYDIQGELNKHFATKIIPKISFHLDTGPRYAQHIEELVKKIHEE